MNPIPFMDLIADYAEIRDDIDAAIRGVIDTGRFILGPDVAALESEIADYLGLGHAAGVGSGTDALVLTLRALDVGPGDEVIVPAFTFFATAEAVMLVGATPVFADVVPGTYLIDPEEVDRRITNHTRAVIPVHLYGHSADMDELMSLASKHDVAVIEDAAQAMGAEWKGTKVGAIGTAGCLSFFPSKTLGGFGDGGMVVSEDPQLVERVKMLRTHGWRKKYEPEMLGYNSRLDTIQAAVLRPKLRHLDKWNEARRERASRYDRLLGAIGGLQPPIEVDGARHVYHVYVVTCERRDEVQEHLKSSEIGTGIYYPIPLHLTAPCSHLPYREGDFPVAEQACRETLAIPLFPTMTQAQLERVAECIGNAMADSRH